MTTIRRRTELHDSGGRLIGGVVDDAVSVLDDGRPPASFRELEVEIGDEMTPTLLDALVERLRQAGAGAPGSDGEVHPRARRPRSARARGSHPRSLRATRRRARWCGARSRSRSSGSSSTIRSFAWTSTPEGVHQARVATRRLRSDLRTFRRSSIPTSPPPCATSSGWLAAILGEVRDGDVLLERLRGRSRRAPGE